MIQIKKISATETFPIRQEVLRKNIPLPFEFNGDFDKDTFHLGAYKDNKLIAVSSFMKSSNKHFKGEQFQLRGMATLEEFQSNGAGNLMMNEAYEILKKLDVKCLWCNAREKAVKFYEKQGMSIIGESFDIQYIGLHYIMFKMLN